MTAPTTTWAAEQATINRLREKIERQAHELSAKDKRIIELRDRLRLIHNEAARGLSANKRTTPPVPQLMSENAELRERNKDLEEAAEFWWRRWSGAAS